MRQEFDGLVNFLDENKVRYSVSEHAAVHTSEEAAAIRSVELRTGVKALVFVAQKEDYNDLVLVLVRADRKADTKKLCALLSARNAKLASPEEVLKKTGCEIGSVHPFGNIFGLPVVMGSSILDNDAVNFSAGMHTKSISMRRDDLVRLIKPQVADIEKN